MLGCCGFFITGWCGGAVYFLYEASKDLDSTLFYAPTNCTPVRFHYDSDDDLYVFANYTVPGNSFNYTTMLNHLDDNAIYSIGHTIPCFYALHDHSYVMAQVGINAGTVVMMVFASIFCIPVAALAIFILSVPIFAMRPMISKLAVSSKAIASEAGTKLGTIFKRKPDVSQDNCDTSTPNRSIGSSVHGYLMAPVMYFKAAFGSMASWLKARFTRNDSSKDQLQDAYGLEDQGSLKSRASSGYSFRSNKKLLSHSKSMRSEASDQVSVETRSL
ncbi:hypothetical protein INT44_000576 [Umbelopsis vinacea]|uniref:Uncharacterized protein n=1 Tax=Umbelopsis vinacea TaxID=44442 RepID=A0A8H7PL79_9FUNG|nr:hypothetical protein INT44_000576 [Umbelopsis vinacea]